MKAMWAPPAWHGWLADKTGCALTTGFQAVAVVDPHGRIRGMVGWGNWTPNSAQAHMAVDTPVAWRVLLPEACRYFFEAMGRGLMVGVIAADNYASSAFAERVGMRLEHRIRDGWSAPVPGTPGVDLLVYHWRREGCRYLRGHHGKESLARTGT